MLLLLVLASAPALFGAGAQNVARAAGAGAAPAVRSTPPPRRRCCCSVARSLAAPTARARTGCSGRGMIRFAGNRMRARFRRARTRRSRTDPDRRRLVVHGGSDVDETWEWDHRTWEPLGAKGPGPRGHHALTYDAVPQACRAVWKTTIEPQTTDTWAWNGRTWERLAADGPPPRGVFASAFDAKRGKVVIFGGCCGGHRLVGDVGMGRATLDEIATATAPSPRLDSRMAYDPVRDRIVLFGGGDRPRTLADVEYDSQTLDPTQCRRPVAPQRSRDGVRPARQGDPAVWRPRSARLLQRSLGVRRRVAANCWSGAINQR